MCKWWVDVESINTNPARNPHDTTNSNMNDMCLMHWMRHYLDMYSAYACGAALCSGIFQIAFAQLTTYCRFASNPAKMKRDQIKMLSNRWIHFNCFGYFISASIIFTHRFSLARFRCFTEQSAIRAISSALFPRCCLQPIKCAEIYSWFVGWWRTWIIVKSMSSAT